MDKGKHNMVPLPLPHNFGDSIYFDISYGVKHGLDSDKYSLLFMDRATQYDLIYPLRNLTTDLVAVAKQPITDIGLH
eukprot:6222811-Ditylum_brightwellii.AAC.2